MFIFILTINDVMYALTLNDLFQVASYQVASPKHVKVLIFFIHLYLIYLTVFCVNVNRPNLARGQRNEKLDG